MATARSGAAVAETAERQELAGGVAGGESFGPDPARNDVGEKLDLLLNVFGSLEDRLKKLEERPTSSAFVPMRRNESDAGPARGYDPTGSGVAVRQFLPASLAGVPEGMSQVIIGQQYKQNFDVGYPVRINAAAPRNFRGNEDATWADVLAPLKNTRCGAPVGPQGKQQCPGKFDAGESCPVCGNGPVVSKVYGLRDDGQWLYQVRVPGLTGKGDGMAFIDSELIAA